jgi:hypothetical protein
MEKSRLKYASFTEGNKVKEKNSNRRGSCAKKLKVWFCPKYEHECGALRNFTHQTRNKQQNSPPSCSEEKGK